MQNRKKIIIFCLSVAVFVLGFLFATPEKIGVCGRGALDCVEFFSEKIAQPLILMAFSLFLTSVVLFFTKPEVFKVWSKFAIFAIPLLALLIISTPVQCGGGYIGLCLDKEMASIFSGVGFFIVSLMLIIYKSLKLHSQNNLT